MTARLHLLLIALLGGLLSVAVSCGSGGSREQSPTALQSGSSTVTGSPTLVATTPLSEASPGPPSSVFQSESLGVEFSYPSALDQAAAGRCQPIESPTAGNIEIGTNISVTVGAASGATAPAAADAFVAKVQASVDKLTTSSISGVDATRLEYRLQPSQRLGIATFVVREDRLYTLVFEPRDLAQCNGHAGPGLYESILSTFQFLR